jgi:excinuclease ABC subunit C
MFDIQEELKKLPQKPGVYIMKDITDNIIYIGKAINLKNRVRQYFQSPKNQTPKTQKLVPNIKEFEYIVTDSELEALILECNLIKKHKPKYNILLKDDKQYPYIKVTVNETYPRIIMTRKMFKDHAKYYGPFTDVTSLKEVIELIHELWPIRKCSRNLNDSNTMQRPCLNYHIGQCMAPCNSQISQKEYKKFIDEAMALLDGKYNTIIEDLQRNMLMASEELNFEKAAEFRNKINSIKAISEKQKMINSSMEDQDVFAFARAHGEALVQVFLIRAGKLIGREHFMLDSTENMTRADVMTEFIKQFYNGTPFIPKEIILQEEIEDMDIIQTWLSSIKGSKVYITVPQKGEKNKLVDLAAKNAMITLEQFGEKIKRDIQKTTTAVSEIKDLLGLDRDIKRMEAYDISNIQGFESVGSMVVFELGKPKRSDYRKFKIKSVIGPNDYASMEEVLTRRFAHALKEREELKQKNIDIEEGKFTTLPDLIMMDGGKGQVNIAKKVLSQFNLNIQVCGMIKDDNHRTRGLIYEDQELMLPTASEGFKLITRIQDEVHRFAIEYHRTLRADKQLHSILDDITGIGIKRRKALLKHFGSVENIKEAELSEILNVDTMDKRSAEAVYHFFQSKR